MNPQDSQIHSWAVSVLMGPQPSIEPMEPVQPREAASVILLRGGDAALEVLLGRRNPGARFMPDAWVFPGGAADDGDGGLRTTALRELVEEAGIELAGPDALLAWSRWITPRHLPIRFDTHFFAAAAPADADARPDGEELVAMDWFAPEAALGAHARGELGLMFPTIVHLEELAGFRSATAVLAAAPGRVIEPVEPELREGRLVLP
jgi:8-oxo-dGTP pyrophosphatase MutT (NUDIX family)